MTLPPDLVIKLAAAILVGGLVGAEREFRDKAAGFRTIIFICLGSTLFTIFSLEIGTDEDPVRIAANVVSGVGFLGAGAIMRDSGQIKGLTTAATIWLAAALGMGIGAGQYEAVGVATAATLIVLMIFPRIESRIDNLREARTYELVCIINAGMPDKLNTLFRDSGLKVRSSKQVKSNENMICTLFVTGAPASHASLIDKLFADPEIKDFRY